MRREDAPGVIESAIPVAPPPRIVAAVLAEISPDCLGADVRTLVGFGTRHTLSETTSNDRGIGAARRWIRGELERYAQASGRTGSDGMTVSFEAYTQAPDGKRIPRDVEIVNVMAVLPGRMPEAAARRYYVVGHYDSRVTDVNDATSDAPGANDDGSGTALVLELARVLAPRRFDSTIVLLATAAEEQGLYGAKHRAHAARDAGEDVRAVLSDDIVGDPSSSSGGAPFRQDVRVFSEGVPEGLAPDALAEVRRLAAESDAPSRELARYVLEVALWERLTVRPTLVFRPDRFLRGGDHLAFNEVGMPAVRFTTKDEHFERQHQNVRVESGVRYGDVPEFVDADYLAGVARVNAAALMHLADAPSAPQNVVLANESLGHGVSLSWSSSPEPDVAGYEVVWRETTSPTWQMARDVKRTTAATLPDVSKDDHFVGVRAYDTDGFRSPVTFAKADKR